MVSFICDACQETVKKSKVHQHVNHCVNCWYLSCVDCHQRFQGDEYALHTSGISEAEKHEGSTFQAKKKENVKQDQQTRWTALVRRVGNKANAFASDPPTARVLKTLTKYENIPRKEGKFRNFLKNSFAKVDEGVLEKVWKILEREWLYGTSTQSLQNDKNNKRKRAEDSNSNKAMKHPTIWKSIVRKSLSGKKKLSLKSIKSQLEMQEYGDIDGDEIAKYLLSMTKSLIVKLDEKQVMVEL